MSNVINLQGHDLNNPGINPGTNPSNHLSYCLVCICTGEILLNTKLSVRGSAAVNFGSFQKHNCRFHEYQLYAALEVVRDTL